MNTATDFLNNTVYPELYHRIPQALPEFDFVLVGGHYENRAKLKVTGEAASNAGKVYIYENNPGRIIGVKASDITASIWDYLQTRDNLTNGETFALLCSLAGVAPPEIERSPEQLAAIVEKKRREEALEVLNAYFIKVLHTDLAPPASDTREYLKGRGCNPATLRKPGSNLVKDGYFTPIEAGFIPGRDAAKKCLEDAGFSDQVGPLFEGVGESAPFFPRDFGRTHRLLFAIRDAGGAMAGFVSRRLDQQQEKKYLYTSSKRGENLLNFYARHFDRHTKTAVIVEGVLDALFAGAAGLPNIFAIAGAAISEGHIELLKRAKVSEVILFFDADKGGDAGRLQGVEVLRAAGFAVFIAKMPDGKGKDLADLLQYPDGVEEARRILEEAKGRDAWAYLFEVYLNELNAGEMTPANVRTFAGKVAALASALPPFERDQVGTAFEKWAAESESGLTRAALEEEAAKIHFDRERAQREAGLKNAIAKANALLLTGEGEKALTALEAGLEATKKATVSDLLPPRLTAREVVAALQNRPPGLETGWHNLDKFFRIQRGLLTLIAGRPSCGKTAAMLNLLRNLADNREAGALHYFAFEDNRENYVVKLLGIILGLDFRADLNQGGRYPKAISNQQFLEAYLSDPRPQIVPQIETAKAILFDLLDAGKIQIYREGYTAEQLAAIFKHLADRDANSVCFVDYIQRLRTQKDFRDTTARLEYVSNLLNESAQKTGLALIAGSQLNRASAGREEKNLEGLKGSGSLEEDAGAVLSIFNPYKEAKEGEQENATRDNGRTVDGWKLTATKNRYGKPDESAFFAFDQYTQKLDPTPNGGQTTYKKA